MILTREKILEQIETGKLKIVPFEPSLVTENGIDLRIDREVYICKKFDFDIYVYLDSSNPEDLFEKKVFDKYITIKPKEFALVTTVEYIELPENIVGLCNLRSTLARWGLSIPPTVVDAGFRGTLTIELVNNTNFVINIPVYTPFLHLILLETKGTSRYNGNYQGQLGVTLPKRVSPQPPFKVNNKVKMIEAHIFK